MLLINIRVKVKVNKTVDTFLIKAATHNKVVTKTEVVWPLNNGVVHHTANHATATQALTVCQPQAVLNPTALQAWWSNTETSPNTTKWC